MIDCPGCNSSLPLVELQIHRIGGIGYRLYACSACDLHFWDPRIMPDPSFYESTQKDESKARMFRHDLIDYELRPYHREFFTHPPSPGRILDIGCGDGTFLVAARAKGFEAWGLDLDTMAIEVALKRGLEHVSACTLDRFVLQNPQHYDVITIFEVLEHQADPAAFMAQLRSILAQGGVLYGSVPNRRRWQTAQDDRWDSPPHHFTRWTAASLRQFLSLQGFTDIVITNVAFGYRVMSGYGKLAGHFKRRSFSELSERDMVLFPIEQLNEARKISGAKSLFFRGAKQTVRGLMTPFVQAETALEKLTGRGQTLVFRCHRA